MGCLARLGTSATASSMRRPSGAARFSATPRVPQNAATVTGDPAAASVQGSSATAPNLRATGAAAAADMPTRNRSSSEVGRKAMGRGRAQRNAATLARCRRDSIARFRYDGATMDRLPPVTRALLMANVAIFIVQLLTGDLLIGPFALWPFGSPQFRGAPDFEIWQLVSYGFLHGSLTHLFFNMFALFMFGSEIERLLGSRRYLTYYMVCVIGAAAAQLVVLGGMNRPPVPTVGASGGVFGLLLAFGMAFPHRKLMLIFPPIPMPAWLFVTLYGLLELYLGVTGSGQGVAHFAHLGGMAAGYVLLVYWARHGGARR
jgi:membrane associated rhomboid family serine protease